jgi:predicted membrane chloride channel (bestrophin family)
MYISAWLTDLHDHNLFKIHFASPTMTCIMELQKALSDIDKLATTPVPADYLFYLHMTMMVWLFFLPFQLQSLLDWMTIPATAIIATIYLGFLEIGNHLDFPFASDLGNLDLETYVLKIAMQLAEITAVSNPHILFRIKRLTTSSQPPCLLLMSCSLI